MKIRDIQLVQLGFVETSLERQIFDLWSLSWQSLLTPQRYFCNDAKKRIGEQKSLGDIWRRQRTTKNALKFKYTIPSQGRLFRKWFPWRSPFSDLRHLPYVPMQRVADSDTKLFEAYFWCYKTRKKFALEEKLTYKQIHYFQNTIDRYGQAKVHVHGLIDLRRPLIQDGGCSVLKTNDSLSQFPICHGNETRYRWYRGLWDQKYQKKYGKNLFLGRILTIF